MGRRLLSRSAMYESLGVLLLSAGTILGCFLGSRIIREVIDKQVARHSDYLVVASTPAFKLPMATPSPTLLPTTTPLPTPTPKPTATPLPMPATRLSVPAINVNVPIEEIYPIVERTWDGRLEFVWEIPAFDVGHYNTSGSPAEGANIVLVGHNNTAGAVFRHLAELNEGDDVVLFTADNEFHYKVQEKIFIPYWGSAEATLQFYTAPKSTERVTLVSCWPFATNTHRVVVIAAPSFGENHAE